MAGVAVINGYADKRLCLTAGPHSAAANTPRTPKGSLSADRKINLTVVSVGPYPPTFADLLIRLRAGGLTQGPLNR